MTAKRKTKVTIIVSDTNDGVNVKVDFDPPAKRNQKATQAQHAAMLMLDALGAEMKVKR